MTLAELIDAATRAEGTHAAVARKLGTHRVQIGSWKSGKHKPSAGTIAQLADMIGVSVLETVAEIEAQLHPEVASVWERALAKLKAK